ncbi:unnamed protein product [Meloidogyne enterolobii]|uniref:Uncharacterized protein n=1 Tax=Meloidogyne enterolobii TaxID=390850 RepID=A0ACB0YR60_MELEN
MFPTELILKLKNELPIPTRFWLKTPKILQSTKFGLLHLLTSNYFLIVFMLMK